MKEFFPHFLKGGVEWKIRENFNSKKIIDKKFVLFFFLFVAVNRSDEIILI
jgi:hypothetical protein